MGIYTELKIEIVGMLVRNVDNDKTSYDCIYDTSSFRSTSDPFPRIQVSLARSHSPVGTIGWFLGAGNKQSSSRFRAQQIITGIASLNRIS